MIVIPTLVIYPATSVVSDRYFSTPVLLLIHALPPALHGIPCTCWALCAVAAVAKRLLGIADLSDGITFRGVPTW